MHQSNQSLHITWNTTIVIFLFKNKITLENCIWKYVQTFIPQQKYTRDVEKFCQISIPDEFQVYIGDIATDGEI